MTEETHERLQNNRVQGEMRIFCLPKKKKSEALQLEKTENSGNNDIAVWLCVINIRESNVVQ
jgi:hypothetical protein